MRTENNLNKEEVTYKETWANRDIVLSEIGMTYKEYLSSDHWKELKKRASRKKRYKQCNTCGTKEKLQLHHRHYRFMMHIHELHSIVCLCDTCHNSIHLIAYRNDLSVRLATNAFLKIYKNRFK